ncbi:Bug family tripartite tricarboxylate transporter substrate binding protein [Varunaivibrio sulfuroxidans]|uniref:Tripartite-type tricarboxylate transporter receptor subunit TctC n=1 Tax=Varunaivibrio sulfuroxidans TaxID=1773489 RepID=A0A4R3JD26_9PROT|nr:tripartite tricarboxylate transporter substrate binding protein [Varunaivibrio sulfuroxidans]TCS63096.1 tripartite-type tricarboxylate transporter receptor subunit TctC [Varunaivibrio sulfuroxidans]WES31832.1 tripartite tricarboxylate transporter substrate binding protein [Varunaivibrio sulfuroxidans]
MFSRYAFIKKVSVAIALGAVAVYAGSSATARAEYPDRPIEMTVLFGGSALATAQVLAEGMSQRLPQPVAAVSRTGGGGAVGYSYVHSMPADGYNIVWNSNSISTTYHKGNMPFDYKAFDPVAQVSVEVPALAVNASSGWNSLADLIKAAKAKGGKLKVGISGKGSFTHLTSEALFSKAGVKVIYVPYGKGSAQAELLGGRIDAAVQWPSQFISLAQAGKLKILAVTSAKRIDALPDVPTAKEQGIDIDIKMWRGIAVPKGTPKRVIGRLEEVIQHVVNSKAFRAAGKKLGFKPAYLPANIFGKVIASDDTKIAALMEELHMKKQ